MRAAESPAVEYALWCIKPDNKKVPHYVKKQCAAWLEIVHGNVPGVYVCDKTFTRICNLLKLIIHPDLHKPVRRAPFDKVSKNALGKPFTGLPKILLYSIHINFADC